jgi:hypothetical protein
MAVFGRFAENSTLGTGGTPAAQAGARRMPMAAALVFSLLLAGHTGYTHVGYADGVDVYRQLQSPLIDLLAEGDFEAPPAVVSALLLDYTHAGLLSPRVVESRVLSADERVQVVYQRLRLPLISDRDFTLRISHGARGAVRSIRFFVDSSYGPGERSGVVRLSLMNGGWELVPISDGAATHAIYHLQLDLAGEIPRRMVSGGAASDLPVLFQAVRRQLRIQLRPAW